VRIREDDVTGPEASRLLDAYFAYRAEAFPRTGAYVTTAPDPADYAPGRGAFLVLEDDYGRAVGCAGLRMLPGAPPVAEVKHVWIEPAARGRGRSDALLDELERRARELGAAALVLDTHHTLTSAARLYARHGFAPTPPYNANPNATVWLRKDLDPS
jgi:GNAT superfamily N-acetyltransferase